MILSNEVQLDAKGVRERLWDLIEAMERWQAYSGELAVGITHLLKVTRSYWSGLFHCYDIEGLPRTNNDLEHIFGKWRHHQRRCTGRKVIPANAVIRGSVQLVAAIATQLQSYSASDERQCFSLRLAALTGSTTTASTQACSTATLPPLSRYIFSLFRTATSPVNFAVLVFLGSCGQKRHCA